MIAVKRKIRRGGNHEKRASQPTRVPEGIEGGGGRDDIIARDHRSGAGRYIKAQVFVVASQRSEICQRTRLLRQSGEEPEGQRARRADRGQLFSRQPVWAGNR